MTCALLYDSLKVRSLWKGLESYMEKSQGEREIVSSIVDKTLQKYSIDAANIQISIPHLMLRECEVELRRVGVDKNCTCISLCLGCCFIIRHTSVTITLCWK